MKHLIACSLLILFTFTSMLGQKEPPQVARAAERLFVISGLGGNVAFLITSEGVLVVDAGNSPSDGQTILRIIKEKTDKPVKYLVLTHYHPDHVNGLQAFPPGIISVGQRNIIKNLHERTPLNMKYAIEQRYPAAIERITKKIAELKAKNSPDVEREEKNLADEQAQFEEYKTIKILDPVQTFEKNYTIVLGVDTIDLIYPGPGHTSCNLVVYFRTQKIVHTGDLLFEGTFPYMMWEDGSDTKNWAEFLRTIVRDWQIDKVIPGHGSITNKEGLLKMAEYLTDLRVAVEAAMKQGQSLDEMKKSISMSKYKEFKRSQGLPQNIETVYHELGGK